MAILTHKCPHPKCLAEHIGLRVVAISDPQLGNRRTVAHLVCPRCRMPSAAYLEATNANPTQTHQLMQTDADILCLGWKIDTLWPAVPEPEIPESLPPNVERIYLQAERNFPVAGNEEAAGTMYRKALDVGLKIIDPSVTGVLKARIAALVKQNKLTPSLGEWADQIRLLGNDTAHDEDALTRAEITALRSFSDLVLRYLFTLPEMVEARKAATAPKSQ
jgi:uncharacterized protein DUF4145